MNPRTSVQVDRVAVRRSLLAMAAYSALLRAELHPSAQLVSDLAFGLAEAIDGPSGRMTRAINAALTALNPSDPA